MHDSSASSAPVVMEAKGLGIQYRRYHRKVTTLKSAALSLFRGSQFEPYWAVRDVDLTVRQGESLGIVGPNGSGKSTLLKALAGILPIAEGTLQVTGKVAPLIELSGGFNQDLTGRENIYLNGAIMGLSRAQVDAKIDSIIEFAALGDFIDAPLNTYSSGMRARLGFAVATDVDPDILLLDEVFAVGDSAFKKKATARIERFFRSNHTVITVSHSLDIITRLCDRAIYLRAGAVVANGNPKDVVKQYLEDVEAGFGDGKNASSAPKLKPVPPAHKPKQAASGES